MTIYRTKKEIRNFFKKQGLTYLKRTRVVWKSLLSLKLDESPYYKDNQEEFERFSKIYAKYIEKSHIAPIYIKKIDDKVGYGVFAAETIKKNDFIGEYTGVVQAADENAGIELDEGGYESDFSWYYLDEIKECPNLEINGRFEGNEMRFLNHNIKPNIEVEHILHDGQWIIFFIAARGIKKDEQLLISYGDGYWEDGSREMESL